MELTGVDWGEISREAHDVTHMGISAPGSSKFGNRIYIPGDLSDPGLVVMEGFFDTLQTDTIKQPPIDQPKEILTLTWPLAAGDANAAIWASDAICTRYQVQAPFDDVMVVRASFKLSGEVTVTLAN